MSRRQFSLSASAALLMGSAAAALDDEPIKLRIIWTGATAGKPHWEQAYSEDGGETWAVNRSMDFSPADAAMS